MNRPKRFTFSDWISVNLNRFSHSRGGDTPSPNIDRVVSTSGVGDISGGNASPGVDCCVTDGERGGDIGTAGG